MTEKLEESRSREIVLREETEELKLKLLKAEKQANQTESDLIQGALNGVVAQLRAEFRKPEELEIP